jgi:hypothetical protein
MSLPSQTRPNPRRQPLPLRAASQRQVAWLGLACFLGPPNLACPCWNNRLPKRPLPSQKQPLWEP